MFEGGARYGPVGVLFHGNPEDRPSGTQNALSALKPAAQDVKRNVSPGSADSSTLFTGQDICDFPNQHHNEHVDDTLNDGEQEASQGKQLESDRLGRPKVWCQYHETLQISVPGDVWC